MHKILKRIQRGSHSQGMPSISQRSGQHHKF